MKRQINKMEASLGLTLIIEASSVRSLMEGGSPDAQSGLDALKPIGQAVSGLF